MKIHEPGEPLRVACGVGVNSTAMLIGLRHRDIVPDLILFADTGVEHPDTYAYRDGVLNPWLDANGFPQIVTVKKRSPRTGDRSLYDECWRKGCLPSASYGKHSCSHKWKIRPQEQYTLHWEPARAAWAKGLKVITAIGYDAGSRDRARSCNAYAFQQAQDSKRFRYWYPLQEWGWDREECAEVITGELLPVPRKSACTICGFTKKPELDQFIAETPEVFWQAVFLEDRAIAEGDLRTVKGLGRRFAWRDYFAERTGLRVWRASPRDAHAVADAERPVAPRISRPL